MDFSIILDHPDKDSIISKLMTGVDPKDIYQWLKLKYTDKSQKHLLISIKLLQDFSKSQYTNFFTQFSDDLTLIKEDKLDKKISESLFNNKTYRERLNEYAEKKINIEEVYMNAIHIMTDRIIQVFDKIQENPGGTKNDYALIKWFEVLQNAVEKYDKHKNVAPDQIIQNNYTIQYIDQTNAIFAEAFRETLAEMDPEASLQLMEKFSEKLRKLKKPMEEKPVSIDSQLEEVQVLKQFIVGKEEPGV